jgi:hypothetical protein
VAGVDGAAQTIWYVCNDLDTSATRFLYGSAPIGIEMQVTVWGYDKTGAMGNVLYRRYLLINKGAQTSGADTIKDMYVSQWSDPDIGDGTDDYAGCDTSFGLGYCYNAGASDQFYSPLPPPAVGFDFLQGPAVPAPGDSGIMLGHRIYGKRNLSMTAFYYFLRGDATVTDPTQGAYEGSTQFYNFFQGKIGKTGEYFTDPFGHKTKFALSGDPFLRTGWVDGQIFPAGDRRIGLASGPFTMAPGDTQEIVVGEIAAGASTGIDHNVAISLLKYYDSVIQAAYTGSFGAVPPGVAVSVERFDSVLVPVQITADARRLGINSIIASLKRYDETTFATRTLFDDGLHRDSIAGDGYFADSLMMAPQQQGLYLNLAVQYANGRSLTLSHVADNITTTGPVKNAGYAVVADNLNSDGIVNPGENIRYIVSLKNGTSMTLHGLSLEAFPGLGAGAVGFGDVAGNATSSMHYNEADPASYLQFSVPAYFADSLFPVVLSITDLNHNLWHDTLEFPVVQFPFLQQSAVLTHSSGHCTGTFDVRVIDGPGVRNHLYVIYGVEAIDSTGAPGFTLKDSTDGRTLLLNHALPDPTGQNIPMTDGFKLFRGTIDARTGMTGWSIPSGVCEFSATNGNLWGLEGFGGAIGSGESMGPSLTPGDLHSVLLKLAATDSMGNLLNPDDTTASYAYRYLRGAAFPPAQPSFTPFIIHSTASYDYQDYRVGSLPFAAYDSDNGGRRLAVGYLENNVLNGRVDGKYWPPAAGEGIDNVQSSGPREWFFIFSTPYSTSPDPALMTNIIQGELPLMWMGTPTRVGAAFNAGDQFLIKANQPPSYSDVWVFNPSLVLGVAEENKPQEYRLRQNFPNPFNPSTVIGYQLPVASRVTIVVYDILGRVVTKLVDGVEPPGVRQVRWDAHSEGGGFSSGVYFYRIQASSISDPKRTFTAVNKMLLLR